MKKLVAKKLIENNCVKFSPLKPFTYASGLKGPIYCDNRLVLGHLEFRNFLIEQFLILIKENSIQFDTIGGLATAGIPMAAFLADRMQMPMVYVRPKPKEHGKKNQVEGFYKIDETVLLIEDLINQGSSISGAMMGIKDAGLKSNTCLSIVDYQMPKAILNLKENHLKLFSLTNFEGLLDAAIELNILNENEINLLSNWHKDPITWEKNL